MAVLASFTPYRLRTMKLKSVFASAPNSSLRVKTDGMELIGYKDIAVNPEAFLEAIPCDLADGNGGAIHSIRFTFSKGHTVDFHYVPYEAAKDFLGFDLVNGRCHRNRRKP